MNKTENNYKRMAYILRLRVLLPLLILDIILDLFSTHYFNISDGCIHWIVHTFWALILFILFNMLTLCLLPYIKFLLVLIEARLNINSVLRNILLWIYALVAVSIVPLLYNDVIYDRLCNKITEFYLQSSHKQIGVIYGKNKENKKKYYTIRVGISANLFKEHPIYSKYLYESVSLGDTVLIRVSDKYPRINRVLNWQPTREEIEKYKRPVSLIE